MTEISTLVGQQIRECRKKRNMTLEDMAGLIGKSRSTISKYEKGEIPVDMETLYMIARTLEMCIRDSCYDVRFPELYRLLAIKGAKVFFVPVSFTKETGEEHLELLLRARAVEDVYKRQAGSCS